MKRVYMHSAIDGHTEIVEVETQREFENLWRYPWLGDGTPWEDLEVVEDD